MSNCYPAFSLPFLHRELADVGNIQMSFPESIKYIWAGLPNMPKGFYWSAPNYVFDSIMAEHCVKDLEAMSEMGMTGVPVQALAIMGMNPKERKEKQELNDLKTFAQNGFIQSNKKNIDSNTIFVAAQKMLLWAWLLEEKALEMRGLVNKYKENATSTIDPLFVDEESSLDTLLNVQYQLDEGGEQLPSWKMVLENAAVFLPDESVIFVSCQKMISDLQEILNFQKGSDQILKICGESLISKYSVVQSKCFVYEALAKKSNDNKYFGLNKSMTFILLRGLNESIYC